MSKTLVVTMVTVLVIAICSVGVIDYSRAVADDRIIQNTQQQYTQVAQNEGSVVDNITKQTQINYINEIVKVTPQLQYDDNSVVVKNGYMKCLKDEHILQWSSGDDEWDCVRPAEAVFGKVVATERHGIRESSTGVIHCEDDDNLLVWQGEYWECRSYNVGGEDNQTLSFEEGHMTLSISNGNTVDLSSLVNTDKLRELVCSDGEVAKYNGNTSEWECAMDAGGLGSTTFLGLSDTPNSYSGFSNYFTRVNSAGDNIEFVDGSDLYHAQGGNSYGALSILGTNDNHNLAFETNGVTRAYLSTDGHFVPNADDVYDLGIATNRWRDLYLGPTSLHIGNNGNEGILSYSVGDSIFNFDKAISIGDNATGYTLPPVRGAAGHILKMDGSGNLT